jgi:hypothetical protein
VHPVPGGDLGRGLVVDEEGRDDQAGFRHGRASAATRVSPMTCDSCRLCLEPGHCPRYEFQARRSPISEPESI